MSNDKLGNDAVSASRALHPLTNPLDFCARQIPFDIRMAPDITRTGPCGYSASVERRQNVIEGLHIAVADSGGNLIAFPQRNGRWRLLACHFKCQTRHVPPRPYPSPDHNIFRRRHPNSCISITCSRSWNLASRGCIPLIDRGPNLGAIGLFRGNGFPPDDIVARQARL